MRAQFESSAVCKVREEPAPCPTAAQVTPGRDAHARTERLDINKSQQSTRNARPRPRTTRLGRLAEHTTTRHQTPPAPAVPHPSYLPAGWAAPPRSTYYGSTKYESTYYGYTYLSAGQHGQAILTMALLTMAPLTMAALTCRQGSTTEGRSHVHCSTNL
eukprot:scaffold16776_cov71-Phaeocystis_antarctica.AAC.5